MANQKKYRVFISAAEPSADSHCAKLITAFGKTGYDIECVGVGGPEMANAGCRLLEETTSRAAMLYNAFTQVFHYGLLIRRISRYLQSNDIDLVIVCDSPAFNFHVAKAAKKAGIGTLFYVAPQLWAWGRWRMNKLRRTCDKLCCILPFEQSWFAGYGIDAAFVGHPMLDGLTEKPASKPYSDYQPRKARILLLPGSRSAEIDSLWRPMQQVVVRLRRRLPNIETTTIAVDDRNVERLKAGQILGFKSAYRTGTLGAAAIDADFALVASGSATLQLAAAGCPMIVMYQSSRIMWNLISRWLIKSEYLSLPNILAEKNLVPEFMPYFTSTEPIADAAEQLLNDPERLAQLSAELTELIGPLARINSAEETARIAADMLSPDSEQTTKKL